jgi:hypothetical protein
MSRVYHSETGKVVPLLCEELTSYRRARKTLHLPNTDEPAELFVLARSYPDNELPLRVAANGTELPSISPDPQGGYRWYKSSISPSVLVPGANEFEFWTDGGAMNGWSLAIENGHRNPASLVTTDGGATWRDEAMGYLNVSRGEYVVRVRLSEGRDPPPPSMTWEDFQHPRLERIRQMLPSGAFRGPILDRVRVLTSWICTQWKFRCTRDGGVIYAPWDVETIIAWGRAEAGHAGREPIVMCVHYGVALVSCCMAAGIPARCAVFTGSINSEDGHFTAEVWFEELGKWVMVDPTLDAILLKEGMPLSVSEIRQAGPELEALIAWGPGYDFQLKNKNSLIGSWFSRVFANGVCFRHRSIWPRTDFLTHPEFTPGAHGWTSYCETDLVWETGDLRQGFGMFPYFADEGYFDAPPVAFPDGR